MPKERLLSDTEVALFGLIAVDHPAGREPMRTAGRRCQRLGHPATRAGFGGRHRKSMATQVARESRKLSIEWTACDGDG